MANLLISAAELHELLGRPRLSILDCRFDLFDADAGRNSYLEAHIPDAVFADLDNDLSGPIRPSSGRHPLPDPGELAATFGQLGIANSNRVVVYDESNGALAARAWWLLRWMGHDNVSLLDGGLARWRALSLPLKNGNPTVVASEFVAQLPRDTVLTTEEIVAAGSDVERLRLIDARDVSRFYGDSEPIDAVAGHIPGAGNLPFTASLNADGTWKRPEELSEMWTDMLGKDKSAPWSVMCGSGVTACHLAISGLLSGRVEPRLYVGSWSEWIRDSARPISTGDDRQG